MQLEGRVDFAIALNISLTGVKTLLFFSVTTKETLSVSMAQPDAPSNCEIPLSLPRHYVTLDNLSKFSNGVALSDASSNWLDPDRGSGSNDSGVSDRNIADPS